MKQRNTARKIGKTNREVFNVEIDLISLRLEDGTFIGPRIVLQENNKKYILFPGDKPLNFDQKAQEQLVKKGWNTRSDYSKVTELKKLIKAAGKVQEPLELIFSGDRLFPYDGHHRLIAVWELIQEGMIFKTLLANIYVDLSIREAENRLIVKDTQNRHDPISYSKILNRRLQEDLRAGLTEEESKEQFIETLGWTSQRYDDLIKLNSLPPVAKKCLKDNAIAETPFFKFWRDKKLSQDEKEKIFAALAEAFLASGKKITGAVLDSTKKGFIKDKEKALIEAAKKVEEANKEANKDPEIKGEKLTSESSASNNNLNTDHSYLNHNNNMKEEAEKVAVEVIPKVKMPKAKLNEKAAQLELLLQEGTLIYPKEEKGFVMLKIPTHLYEQSVEIIQRGIDIPKKEALKEQN